MISQSPQKTAEALSVKSSQHDPLRIGEHFISFSESEHIPVADKRLCRRDE